MLVAASRAQAAETSDPLTMSKTLVVVQLDAKEALTVLSTFQPAPPTIILEFPKQQVRASLPERSAISKGVIQDIMARYDERAGPMPMRFIRSLHIVLRAPYAYRARSEPGRVVVEIEHPAAMHRMAVGVGLIGGVIIEGWGHAPVNERFRAMQEALTRAAMEQATPRAPMAPSTTGLRPFRNPEAPARSSAAAVPEMSSTLLPASLPRGSSITPPGATGQIAMKEAGPSRRRMLAAPEPASRAPFWGDLFLPSWSWQRMGWMLFALGLTMGGTLAWAFSSSSGLVRRVIPRPAGNRVSSALTLIDQLVWSALKGQGYDLVAEKALTTSDGMFRLIRKEGGQTSALLVIGDGMFFEKHTVERFVQEMRAADAPEGLLVTSGSYTVPAQRVANAHRITLIGRDQLPALLSAGAMTEFVMKELEQQRVRVEEAKDILRQYAGELGTLRRQRNEASWALGEERANSAQLEAQLETLTQQLHRHEITIQQWERDASILRARWEESQWYLGESRARTQHLEAQLVTLQETAMQLDGIRRERDEAHWYLGEERARREALALSLDELQKQYEGLSSQERVWREAVQRLTSALQALRAHGERRRAARINLAEMLAECSDGSEGAGVSAALRDLSVSGVGVTSDAELPAAVSIRLRLRLPGAHPIESQAQVVWQRAQACPAGGYQSGLQFIDLPETAQTTIQHLIEQAA